MMHPGTEPEPVGAGSPNGMPTLGVAEEHVAKSRNLDLNGNRPRCDQCRWSGRNWSPTIAWSMLTVAAMT